MGVQEFFYLPVLLFMLVLFHSVVTQYHCDTREVSIFGKMLQKHIFKTITGAAFGVVCSNSQHQETLYVIGMIYRLRWEETLSENVQFS